MGDINLDELLMMINFSGNLNDLGTVKHLLQDLKKEYLTIMSPNSMHWDVLNGLVIKLAWLVQDEWAQSLL